MKKLIPYILAYLIVATATAIYPHISRLLFTSAPAPFPPNTVALVVDPGLSHDELVAKLQKVGLSEAHPLTAPNATVTIRPAPLLTLASHYIFDAAMLAAFVGLVILFQRSSRTKNPEQPQAV